MLLSQLASTTRNVTFHSLFNTYINIFKIWGYLAPFFIPIALIILNWYLAIHWIK